jgi:selenide,water dikinase
VLGPVQDHPATAHPDLIVGIGTGDDAGAYSLGDGRALIQTVDIFTPVVDSARDWGRIAAANALSDIYAMGASPITALQYLAWPRDVLAFDLATEVLTGGMDVMAGARCTVLGGHTIDGPEPTYGFAVTGAAPVDEIVTNAGARVGDQLVLTKPLGMGIITTAIKRGECPPDLAADAIELMTTLNDIAGAQLNPHAASAATDVTGFGLLGHLREMCGASGVGAVVEIESVPVLDGVLELLEKGSWPGGSERNRAWIEPVLITTLDVDAVRPLMDAQTSGGLLVALPEERLAGYLEMVPGAVRIGTVTSDNVIRVT